MWQPALARVGAQCQFSGELHCPGPLAVMEEALTLSQKFGSQVLPFHL
jgi:hypothetical protein